MAIDPTQAELTKQYFIENYRNMRDQLKQMQPAQIGQRKRTPKEAAEIVSRLHALPPDLRQTMMVMIADKAGHKPDEQNQCELCQFLSEQMANKWQAQASSAGSQTS